MLALFAQVQYLSELIVDVQTEDQFCDSDVFDGRGRLGDAALRRLPGCTRNANMKSREEFGLGSCSADGFYT